MKRSDVNIQIYAKRQRLIILLSISKPVGRVEISFVDPINNFCTRGFANIKYLSKLCVFSLRNITFEFHDTSTITNVFVFINVNKTKIRRFQKH